MDEQLIETWNIHNRINLYMLDAVSPEALVEIPSFKGRSAGQMFAHIHNTRLLWLKSGNAALLEGLEKIEKEHAGDKSLLHRSLGASGQAIETLLRDGLSKGGKIKGFKPHAVAFLGYMISHESYHRGEIGIVLAQSGHPLDNKISYGMWEWGVR